MSKFSALSDSDPIPKPLASRRSFIKVVGTGAVAVGISACGGARPGFFESDNTAQAAPPPTTTPPNSNPPPEPPAISSSAPGVLATSFQLQSPIAGDGLPFTIGHAFRKGQVPAGASVVGSIPDLQISACWKSLETGPVLGDRQQSAKNWWSDGSLKFALVSGHAKLASAAPLTVTLTLGDAVKAGAILTIADLIATDITATIDAQEFGAATWSGNDWNSSFMAWASGAQMSSWIYRRQIGSDAHLVGWLEVRLYASCCAIRSTC